MYASTHLQTDSCWLQFSDNVRWVDLPPELIVSIACSSPVNGFLGMLRACKSWFKALSADANHVWARMVHTRFPNVAEILRMLPPSKVEVSLQAVDYLLMYRDLLNAQVRLFGA